MSDPVSQSELEDVLAAIRRLVSEERDHRSAGAAPEESAAARDKLVLTPALRVQNGAARADLDQHLDEDDDEDEGAAAAAEPQVSALSVLQGLALHAAGEGRDRDIAGGAAAGTAGAQDEHPADTDEEPSVERAPEGPDTADDALAAADEAEIGAPEDTSAAQGARGEDARAEIEDLAEVDGAPEILTAWSAAEPGEDDLSDRAGLAEAEATPADDRPTELAASTDAEPEPEAAAPADGSLGSRTASLESKIAELEAMVGMSGGDWEPDGGESAASPESSLSREWDEEPEPDEDGGSPAAAGVESDRLEFEETVLDEEMLRDMVAEIVRAELQGELGERITRNVRKLVRREIHRALAAQVFD
ncbi:hypothetical protein DRV85_00155 [Rhodosalinus halophilus]|uniref:DUF2497 domain-containing protein n=1 Tax=Rhodosalinus halophilus TaxID=2259333 RepID=A0A365UCY4_9RHOB|nr:hypothetical protein [Rhodosalinus halophilus]RBI87388.1 hypothetical protein DRV85_00155 [Rhodosalinus halophilus]